MAKNTRPSRLDPVYLLRRHAGTVFLFLAVGLCAGVAYRALVRPARYSAAITVPVMPAPPEKADRFDWTRKNTEWSELLRDREELGLIGGNIRHALKLAVTENETQDTERLPEILLALGNGGSFSTAFFTNPYAASLAPAVTTSRNELAANMDIQSLATIIADLDPAPGAEGWDFRFFRSFLPATPEEAVIADGDRNNPYLRVLFTLHRVLTGAEARGLADAWRTAAAEVTSRLDREAQFTGGGGFGPVAAREMLREIHAVPALAANNLYRADDWYGGRNSLWESSTHAELANQTPASGTARITAAVTLRPLRFPRDTVFTRTPALVAATVLATLAARERAATPIPEAPPPAPEPAKEPEPEAKDEEEKTESAEPPPATATAAPTPPPQQPAAPPAYREEVDEAANRVRLETIAGLEESIRMAARDREACLRRLAAAREDETRLSVEAMHSRKRADRLRERYDEASVPVAGTGAPKISEEVRVLFVRRDEITRRLNELLAYCTAEHPFVVAALRELEAVEATLSEYAVPDPREAERTDAFATRAANLYVEWESASATADALEERRGRQAEATRCLTEELDNIEDALTQLESDLAATRQSPVPTRRVPVERKPAPPPPPAPRPAAPAPAPEPIAAPAQKPAPASTPVPAPTPPPAPKAEPEAHLEFPPSPGVLPIAAEPRGLENVYAGLAAGGALGILASLLRELFSARFRNAGEARRLAGLPVLAVLPSYDPKSLRLAAATVKGELIGKGADAVRFLPNPVELFEPPAEARRGRVTPLKRRPRVLAWVLGLVLILGAGILYYLSMNGLAQPAAPFRGDLPLPAATVPVWAEERGAGAGERGDMP